jgi:hypothetical protein
MTTPPTPPGWRVISLTVHFGGSIYIVVQAPNSMAYNVNVSRDGDWDIVAADGGIPTPTERSAIMATVSAYSIRQAFGGNTR